jgi:AbrB family looped-hinge helix DNA binding protein
MVLRAEMDEAGRVALPEEMRAALGLGPGSALLLEQVGDDIIIRSATVNPHNGSTTPRSVPGGDANGHRKSLRGILRNPNGPSFPTDEALDAAIDAAWPEATREEWLAKERG